jgi:FlaA1/EpsC-like NDP-sugar epimerase
MTNIIGVSNVIEAARDNRVKKVLFTSSDKAVNPTSVMGTSKLMGERLMTAASSMSTGSTRTIFASTRFGNVAGSRGSVIPLVRARLAAGLDIQLTHVDMTRFLISLDDSVDLLLASLALAKGGEVFIMKMKAIVIADLLKALIAELAPRYGRRPEDVRIVTIGGRPGEKVFEELISEGEVDRCYELDNLFVISPPFVDIERSEEYSYLKRGGCKVRRVYHSSEEPPLAPDDIAAFLRKANLLTL